MAEDATEEPSGHFQEAARTAQGGMSDAEWWKLSAHERAEAIYRALRMLDAAGTGSPLKARRARRA
jgi:hypothetical protein